MLLPGEIEIYREVQPLHRNMLLRAVLPFETVVLLGVLATVAAGSTPTHTASLAAVFVVFGVLLPWWLLTRRLIAVVTDRRLLIRFSPFPGRTIELGRVISVEPVRYSPLADAGGWGWRLSRRYHRVFNVSGDRGVHVRYGPAHADQFLLGSDHPETLAAAIEAARLERAEGPADIRREPAAR